jgi:putative flippase GtrA
MMQASERPSRIERRRERLLLLGSDLTKYGLASAAALALDYGLLLFLHTTLGLDYLVAAAIGFLSGLLLVYALSIRYVFGDRRRIQARGEFLGFFVIGLIGLALNEFLMHVFVAQLGLSVALAKIPTAGFVFASNFTARRALLFSRPARISGEASCAR